MCVLLFIFILQEDILFVSLMMRGVYVCLCATCCLRSTVCGQTDKQKWSRYRLIV